MLKIVTIIGSLALLLIANPVKVLALHNYTYPTAITGTQMRQICGHNIDWLIVYEEHDITDDTEITIYKAQGTFKTTGTVSNLLPGTSDQQAFEDHHDNQHIGLALASNPTDISYFTCREGNLIYEAPDLVPLREWLSLTVTETTLTTSTNVVDGEEEDCFEEVEWSIAFWNTGIDIAKCTFSVIQDIYNVITDFDISDEMNGILQNLITSTKDKLGILGQVFDLAYTFLVTDLLGSSETFGQSGSGNFWNEIIDDEVRIRSIGANRHCPEGFACGNTRIENFNIATAEECGTFAGNVTIDYPDDLVVAQGYSSGSSKNMIKITSTSSGGCKFKYIALNNQDESKNDLGIIQDIELDLGILKEKLGFIWTGSQLIIQTIIVLACVFLLLKAFRGLTGSK